MGDSEHSHVGRGKVMAFKLVIKDTDVKKPDKTKETPVTALRPSKAKVSEKPPMSRFLQYHMNRDEEDIARIESREFRAKTLVIRRPEGRMPQRNQVGSIPCGSTTVRFRITSVVFTRSGIECSLFIKCPHLVTDTKAISAIKGYLQNF